MVLIIFYLACFYFFLFNFFYSLFDLFLSYSEKNKILGLLPDKNLTSLTQNMVSILDGNSEHVAYVGVK